MPRVLGSVTLLRDHRTGVAGARSRSAGVTVVAFAGDHGAAWCIHARLEQGLEQRRVGLVAAGKLRRQSDGYQSRSSGEFSLYIGPLTGRVNWAFFEVSNGIPFVIRLCFSSQIFACQFYLSVL